MKGKTKSKDLRMVVFLGKLNVRIVQDLFHFCQKRKFCLFPFLVFLQWFDPLLSRLQCEKEVLIVVGSFFVLDLGCLHVCMHVTFEIIQTKIISRGLQKNLCLVSLRNFGDFLSPELVLEHGHDFVVIFFLLDLVLVLNGLVVLLPRPHFHDLANVIQR